VKLSAWFLVVGLFVNSTASADNMPQIDGEDLTRQQPFKVSTETLETFARFESSVWNDALEAFGRRDEDVLKAAARTARKAQNSFPFEARVGDPLIAFAVECMSSFGSLTSSLQSFVLDDPRKLKIGMEDFQYARRHRRACLAAMRVLADASEAKIDLPSLADIAEMPMPSPYDHPDIVAAIEDQQTIDLDPNAFSLLYREQTEKLLVVLKGKGFGSAAARRSEAVAVRDAAFELARTISAWPETPPQRRAAKRFCREAANHLGGTADGWIDGPSQRERMNEAAAAFDVVDPKCRAALETLKDG
jgi:hypothetical protein